MSEYSATVAALTTRWTTVIGPKETGLTTYQPVENEPLLDMLKAAIHSSTGGTSAGRSDASSRSVINVVAFDLWQRIDEATRSWIGDLSNQRPAAELKAAVQQLAKIIEAEWQGDRIAETQRDRLVGLFDRWKADIWAIFDPPITKEIQAECPECGERHYFDLEGVRTSAVIAFYWKGVSPTAQCRRCAATWSGDKELLRLGFSIRANVDVETLRDMGVAV